ncbi:MAG: HEPN domain-containing protein [Betaproteobacteria bacterium]|nr:HEPN domain-containing protein [Betaproteobacteria bacterium]
MSPQVEEARRLLRLARRDQGTFNLLMGLPDAELTALGFHAQQAAEKALKSVCVWAGLPLQRTHDLTAIGAALLPQGVELPLTLDDLRLLNPFAVEFRYDDEVVVVVTREHLASLLKVVMDWADARVEPSSSSD